MQKAQNHSPFLQREQEDISFCDLLPSNSVALNHLNAKHIWMITFTHPKHLLTSSSRTDCVLCLWVDPLSVLTADGIKSGISLTCLHQPASEFQLILLPNLLRLMMPIFKVDNLESIVLNGFIELWPDKDGNFETSKYLLLGCWA